MRSPDNTPRMGHGIPWQLPALILVAWCLQVSEASRSWFSGSFVPVSADGRQSNHRFIDLVISVWGDPAGDNDGNTQGAVGNEEQDAYEEIIQHAADGIYEATEGQHKLRNIRIFKNYVFAAKSDIIWLPSGHPRAKLAGMGYEGGHIWMADIFNNNNLLEDKIGAGYVLAHEYGHYALGLRDEYRTQDGDVAVEPSIMGSMWKARNKASQTLVDPRWLQFSIEYTPPTAGLYENTQKTKQHRQYGESCWETLARSDLTFELANRDRFFGRVRRFYPELASVAPLNGTLPYTRDIPDGDPRSALDVVWADNRGIIVIALDCSTSMFGTKISNAREAAKNIVDMVEEGSYIGVIKFTDEATVVTNVTRVSSDAVRASIKADIGGILAFGLTHIGNAAFVAYGLLVGTASVPNGIKSLFLLSDGHSQDDALFPINLYQDSQIPIFTLSFGSDADVPTLRTMAQETKGRLFISATSLSAISLAFHEAITATTGTISTAAGSVPANNQSFVPLVVDSSLATLNINVVFPSASTASATLFDPDGTSFSPSQTTSSGEETLVLFQVASPAGGQWHISLAGSHGADGTFDFQASGKPVGATLSVAVDILGGEGVITYPGPFVVTADLLRALPVVNAAVTAEITAPDGSKVFLPLVDDGAGVDSVADDGSYALSLQYTQNGIYEVRVRVVAEAGVAAESAADGDLPLDPDGNVVPELPDQPLTESYDRSERIQVEVTGVVDDDHGDNNTFATDLPASTVVSGIIESGGDVDVFETNVSETGPLAIRVSNLLFDMDPVLGVYSASFDLINERTLHDSDNDGNYVVVTLDSVTMNEVLYAKVSHFDSLNGTGGYQISTSKPIVTDEPPEPTPPPTQPPTPQPTECPQGIFRFLLCWIKKILDYFKFRN